MAIVNFQPNNVSAFQFRLTLDGDQYTAIIMWNMVGRRWYINLFALDGTRIFTLPLIGSADAVAIETIAWANGFVNVTTVANHGYLMGATIDLTISRCVPEAYNGIVRAFVTGLDSFQYRLAGDPGDATQLGVSAYDINIAAGYFQTSKLAFRESNQQFEVTP